MYLERVGWLLNQYIGEITVEYVWSSVGNKTFRTPVAWVKKPERGAIIALASNEKRSEGA